MVQRGRLNVWYHMLYKFVRPQRCHRKCTARVARCLRHTGRLAMRHGVLVGVCTPSTCVPLLLSAEISCPTPQTVETQDVSRCCASARYVLAPHALQVRAATLVSFDMSCPGPQCGWSVQAISRWLEASW